MGRRPDDIERAADRRPIAVAFGCLLAAALALSGLTYVRQGASSQAAPLYDEA